MRILYLVSVWLHILAATVWVGGMAFFMLVLVPLMRSKAVGANAGLLIHWIGVRFRSVGWASLGVLVVTGGFNLYARGVRWADLHSGDFWHSDFGETLAVKLAIVATILVISAVHDFKVGPLATRLLREQPDSAQAQRYRNLARAIGRINVVLALAAVALGVVLVRGLP